jgi:hypothetical protein
MSKRLFLFLMILILVLVPVSSFAATPFAPATIAFNTIPGPSGTFSSAFTIQNLSATIANCTFVLYNAAGTASYTSPSFTVPASGSVFTYVPSIGALATGQYSGVVSCDQQVSAVVNSSSTDSGGAYDAVATTATTWYAPNAYNNYYNYYTNFVVQNATASTVNVTVDIINGSGAVVATQTASNVPAYAYVNFEQSGLAGLSANVAYSAKITGTGALAVESNIYGQGSASNQLYSYTPFASGSLTAYAPVIMNNYYGYVTALTVQNIGAATANVTVTYGTGLTENTTIAPSSSHLFYTPNSGLPSGNSLGLTSAKITSDQNIVALVNEQGGYLRSASYSAFASGSTTVSIPIVMKRYVSSLHYNTSITCQNVGASNTNMTITYSNAATATQNSIPANGTALFYQPNEAGLPDNFNGSATVSSSGQPIVCIVNEDQNEAAYGGTTSFDHLFSYESFPAP